MIVSVILIVLVLVTIRLWKDLAEMRGRVEMLEDRLGVTDLPPHRAAPPVVRAAAVPEVQEPLPPSPLVETPAPIEAAPAPLVVELVPPAPEAANEPEIMPDRVRPGFEELFGRRLPIWGGGITLAVAGMLIVKYSIDAGLLSPVVRVVFGLLFGSALIAAAEAALRFDERVGDVRVRQAFAGAGLATLYASVLVAANLYHLIAPPTGFIGLAAVTALAMGLSLRFGAPSALLGLVGGMAAPALIGSDEPNIPLLATYLAVSIGGLCAVSRAQRWLWLGVGALVGGFGWGALLLLGGTLDAAASLAIGLYLALIGILCPMLLFAGGGARTLLRFAGSSMAAVQIAILVAKGGFALLDWGLFGLISVAIIWLSRREPMLARLPVIGLAVMALLLGAWPQPAVQDFAIVLIVGTIIYAGPLLLRLWRTGANEIEAGQIAAIAIGALLLPMIHFYRIDGSSDHGFAILAFAAASLPASAAALGWRSDTRHGDARFVLLAATSALLLAAAQGFALPAWAWAPTVAALALGLLLLSFRAKDERVEYAAWMFAGVGLILLGAGPDISDEIARISGIGSGENIAIALIRWTGLAVISALFAWRARLGIAAMAAQASAAMLGYGAVAQILPADLLPSTIALALLGTAAWGRSLVSDRLLPAMSALLALSVAWATWPLTQWLGATGPSIIGAPVLVIELPRLIDVALRLFGPAVLIIAALYVARQHIGPAARRAGNIVAGILAGVALHIAYKHIFLLTSFDLFVQRGFAERTVWEALLFGAAMAAWRYRLRSMGCVIAAAGMAHFIGYSLLLHNPLWARQAVGSLPLLNWLLPAFAIPMAMLWLAARFEPDLARPFERPRSIAQMVLILTFAFSLLRQIVHGAILSVPGVTEGEDITRSILGIAIAIGFLGWGIRSRSRDWRIASLLLMLAAVGKVFLFDAAGLDGLARIGSFVALGLSLIGLGWLYSRFLKPETGETASA